MNNFFQPGFDAIRNTLGPLIGIHPQPQQPISPVQEPYDLSNPGLLHYYQNDQAMQQQGQTGRAQIYAAPQIQNPPPQPQKNPLSGFFTNAENAINPEAKKQVLGEKTTPKFYFGPDSWQKATGQQDPAQQPQAPLQATDTPLPMGIEKAMQYVSSFVPKGVSPQEYYPALRDPEFMQGVLQADKVKPGLGNVLLLQGFHESSLGRAANNNNIFGALPGGESSGKSAKFGTLGDALRYQLGPNMLGGGGNPNMNIMGESGPLTRKRLVQLYKSYNPEGAYIRGMLQTLQ